VDEALWYGWIDADAERAFKQSKTGWTFFQGQPAGYRRLATHSVVSAKLPETRAKRLASLILHSARGECRPQYVSASKRS
jgi:hypothetical protein